PFPSPQSRGPAWPHPRWGRGLVSVARQVPVGLSLGICPRGVAHTRGDLAGQHGAVARVPWRADDADDDIVVVELLHTDMRRILGGKGDRVLDQLLALGGARLGTEARAEPHPLRLTKRDHGAPIRTPFGTRMRSAPLTSVV